MSSESIVIYANSSKRASGGRSSFTINLTKPITRLISFEILGVEIPYSFYNIWGGNLGICDVTGNGHTLPVSYSSTSPSIDTIIRSEIYRNPLNLALRFDNQTTIINIFQYTGEFDQFSFEGIGQKIIDSGIHGVVSCSLTLVGFRILINITCATLFTSFGVILAGTDVELARYLGLTEDIIVTMLHPNYSTNLTLPSPYAPINRKLPYWFIYGVGGWSGWTDQIYGPAYTPVLRFDFNFLGDNNSDVNNLIVYNMRVNSTTTIIDGYDYSVNPTVGSIFVDPSKHYIGAMLGLDGTYDIGQTITVLPSYISLPKVYNNTITFVVDGVGLSEISISSGNYTNAELISEISSQLASIIEYGGSSTVTLNADNTVSFHLARIGTSVGFGRTTLTQYLGFIDNQLTQEAFDYTFTSTRPIKKYSNIYIQSNALSSLLTIPTATDTDDPAYVVDGLIHKVQINSNPGGFITDNSKYRKEHIVKKLKAPITSIDFTIIDEDGQVIDLNGRDWSIGIKLNF